MRIETVTTEYKIYKYNELSDEAKENVKEWYLESFHDADCFSEICENDLYNLFGDTNLNIQYDLRYCQGDGFNIYGEINAESIFNCLENHNGGTQLEQFENVLTDKEKRTILHYAEECGKIELPMNNHYAYSLADRIDIVDDWTFQLETYGAYRDINEEVLKKFERLVRDIFSVLCEYYEKIGYEWFYDEVSDEEVEEICEANEYEFLEDGSLY
jgi:hypothetical protein